MSGRSRFSSFFVPGESAEVTVPPLAVAEDEVCFFDDFAALFAALGLDPAAAAARLRVVVFAMARSSCSVTLDSSEPESRSVYRDSGLSTITAV